MWVDRVKLGGTVLGVVLVVLLLWQFQTTALLLGWSLLAYVLWRASPAVAADIRRARARLVPARTWRD